MTDINNIVAKQTNPNDQHTPLPKSTSTVQMSLNDEDELNEEKYLTAREEQKRGNMVREINLESIRRS